MKKMSVTTTLALLLVLILGSTAAYAAFHWCPDDPILTITPPGGAPITVNVIIDVPAEDYKDLVDIVRLYVHVPKGAATSFDLDGSTLPYDDVVFIDDGKPGKVKVEVKVESEEKFPVRVTIEAPRQSKHKRGWSNEWVWCKAQL